MPLIPFSDYRPPLLLRGAHSSTIVPSVFRSVRYIAYRRERMETPDGDFIDLDWMRGRPPAHQLVILSHGLEGDSNGQYIRGMARAFYRSSWDVLCWNFRGCSGEPNRLLRMYHSGVSDDLELVVQRALREKIYRRIVLIGFSMGGNITLKYLGERGKKIDRRIERAVAFSVPCHLEACAKSLGRPSNRIYMFKFLQTLREKIRIKNAMFPGRVDMRGLDEIKTFQEFDDRYTAPIHGFDDALDYWTRSSSLQFLPGIGVPTLLVNAKNDPFLAPECFPYNVARNHEHLFFEAPEGGGHVGFASGGSARRNGLLWSELRALRFVELGR